MRGKPGLRRPFDPRPGSVLEYVSELLQSRIRPLLGLFSLALRSLSRRLDLIDCVRRALHPRLGLGKGVRDARCGGLALLRGCTVARRIVPAGRFGFTGVTGTFWIRLPPWTSDMELEFWEMLSYSTTRRTGLPGLTQALGIWLPSPATKNALCAPVILPPSSTTLTP